MNYDYKVQICNFENREAHSNKPQSPVPQKRRLISEISEFNLSSKHNLKKYIYEGITIHNSSVGICESLHLFTI